MSYDDPLDGRNGNLPDGYLLQPREVQKAYEELLEISQSVEFRKKFSETFSTAYGTEVLEWLLAALRFDMTAFTGNAYTNYNCALKDFGGMLFNMVIEANPELASTLLMRKHDAMVRAQRDRMAKLEKRIKEEENASAHNAQ